MGQAIHPVLLCGGSGTRLWPLSRKSYPKQFARLTGDESLFQSSARRCAGKGFCAPTIVTGSEFRFVVLEQLAAVKLPAGEILLEPSSRNTAAAICAAALSIEKRQPGALMLVAPSDHLIPDGEGFQAAVADAAEGARSGKLVTFGIRPDRAETGYGWLTLAEKPDLLAAPRMQQLRSFVEKPDRSTAERLLEEGMHLWNAGIFLFSTTAILEAFSRHAPETLTVVRDAFEGAVQDLNFSRLSPIGWGKLENISIDYAVMERADNLVVMPYSGAWSDLGDWRAVWREGNADAAGNVAHGPATSIDCAGSLLHAASDGQQLVGVGLENIVAIAMPDAVLVASRDRAQDVKLVVDRLKAQYAPQAEQLPRDYRPWGWYESLVTGPRFQVKRIVVNPGASLSLQSHHHRAEHWVVVEGTARVTIDGAARLLTENESAYIPVGAVHRLENPGKLPLTLVEVQTGGYLGEDDIIRYEDAYQRV